jgi:hypothetical protein
VNQPEEGDYFYKFVVFVMSQIFTHTHRRQAYLKEASLTEMQRHRDFSIGFRFERESALLTKKSSARKERNRKKKIEITGQ